MSNDYAAPDININVTAPAPAPAAATPAAPAAVPTASDADVAAFLGAPTPATPAGGAPAVQDPQGGSFLTGFAKGASREVLGALSLLPGVGNLFTRESTLGKMAYAPGRRGSEDIGIGAGMIAPWLVGGEVLGTTRAIGAISDLSPTLARIATGAFRSRGARIAEEVTPTGEIGAAGIPVGQVTAGGSVGGGMIRAKPTLARMAAGGAVGGALQEPEGNTGYSGRIAPALTGALSAAALGGIGLGGEHIKAVGNITRGLAAIIGFEAGGLTGGLGLALMAHLLLHRAGLGVRQVDHLAPLVAEQAQRLAGLSQRHAATVGAVAGGVANEVGSRI